jgi:hypothetical protein
MALTWQLGRLVLREDFTAAEAVDAQGNRTLSISGQESIPRHSLVTVTQRREDLLATKGAFCSATFGTKSYLDGFYQVANTSGTIEDWGNEIAVFRWAVDILRLGTTAEIDVESRLSGSQTRTNNFSATGERTHAPALGHAAYWAGTSSPTAVDRPCADGGNLRVYRAIGNTINPRWATSPSNYRGGRCRLIDTTGQERAGINCNLAASSTWEISNGLISIKPGSAGSSFDIGIWDGTSWEYTSWLVQIDSPYATVSPFDYFSVLRNEYEAICVRLTKGLIPGRFFTDITVRRGSRLAEMYLQHEFGTQMRVIRATAAAGTQTSGYVTANASDSGGNRYVVGSAKTFTANTGTGGVEKTATATLDVMVGMVLNGATAVAGDTAADLYAQYLGMPAELVQGVRR